MQRSAERPVAKGEEQLGSTVPMPNFAGRPSAMNSFSPAEIPQNSMADQQILQISELHFIMFTTKIQNLSMFLFRFSLGGNVLDPRSGDGRVGGRFKNHRALFKEILISRILRCWTRGLHQDHSEFPLQEKAQSGGIGHEMGWDSSIYDQYPIR